jgi:predicted ATPase
MDGQIKKRRTLEAIKRVLLRESLNQPLIVFFEDLHWIDEATQEFLNLLADSIETAKILLLVNYRPEYSHQWGSRTYYKQLRLDPRGKESAQEMLADLLGDSAELVPLKRLIVDKTEGNPFYMEETVQAILASRIDRLPQDAKELLQTLSVIGREYSLSLIRGVVRKSDDELSRLLRHLQLGEFIYEQPAVGDIEYIFEHALTQEAAVNSLLIERRKQLHERIGQALEIFHASSLDDHLAELAHHYGRSVNVAKAVQHLRLAAKQALNKSAFAEAQAQLEKGLELMVQVFLIWRDATASGDYPTAGFMADRLLDLAQREGSPRALWFRMRGSGGCKLLSRRFRRCRGALRPPGAAS